MSLAKPHTAGQALLEALAALLFLVPLLLCVIQLAKLDLAAHAASLATREIALAAIHHPAGEVESELVRRLRDLAISIDDDAVEHAEPSVEPSVRKVELEDAPRAAEAVARVALAPALAAGKGEFDWPAWRGQRAVVGISLNAIQSLQLPLAEPMNFEQQLFFYGGHGAASGPQHVVARTAALSPVGALAEIGQKLEPLAGAASVIEPALDRLCIGRISSEIVPEDRLPLAASRASDLRTQPC
ncbi:MAG: hypothetical protein KJS95_00695 [Gammaproteobacteria bacterium]|nr:hypothetical protein [Gammaproteobacteria bacterium]